VVCIKRLDPLLTGDVDFVEMFKDEAALVLDLAHENIVKVHELVDERIEGRDELYQVMELVDGPSLARIRSVLGPAGPAESIQLGEALQIGVHLCRALHHAHTRTRDGLPDGEPLRIVHRDVSPQNVLVGAAGRTKLVDFGIAKAAQRLTHTQAGTLKGKCSYMAPEQARGEPLDHRADQFAAGILLWEMLTGRRLFGGRNEVLILEQVVRSDPLPPSTVKKGIPRAVDRAVLRALRWAPGQRFADMAELEQALSACLDDAVGRPPPGADHVSLADLVARAQRLGAADPGEGGAARTRVIAKPDDTTRASAPATSDEPMGDTRFSDLAHLSDEPEVNPTFTDPTAHPQHTGQFFRAPISQAKRAAPAVAGVLVAAIAVVAVWLGGRDEAIAPEPLAVRPLFVDLEGARRVRAEVEAHVGSCVDPCAAAWKKTSVVTQVDAARFDACLARCDVPGSGRFAAPPPTRLEQALKGKKDHPCRTELLEDLLEADRLSTLARASLADAVEQCIAAIDARASRQVSAKLEPPAWPKRKKRTPPIVRAHAAELSRRGALALAIGEYEVGKGLLVQAVNEDPARVADHLLIGQAFRGLGDPAGAAYHFRLWLHAFPGEPEEERVRAYLVRYRQSADLKPAVEPAADERRARVRRLVVDASAEAPPERIAPLEEARRLAPDDVDVLERLAVAYAACGRMDDARSNYRRALAIRPSKALRQRLAALGT
jgi:serine/threonine-protein kinase